MLSPADQATLEAWWCHALAHRGALPPGVRPVHVRLVRAVGEGRLPDLGPVFVKVMAFPRPKDRLRYALRALPALHEARMLAAARRAGLCAPEPVFARGARRRLLPRLSMLVTRALDAGAAAVPVAALAALAARMADLGLEHRDLHPQNFLALTTGEVAVLDLQSARLRWTRLGARARVALATKLGAGLRETDLPQLAQAGLVPADSLGEIARGVSRLRVAETARRVRRCLSTSSDFVATRRLRGTLHRRRGATLDDGGWVEGGTELLRCWIGDRALEVLEGRPPSLRALFRRRWWLPGRHRVYVPGADQAVQWSRDRPTLLFGFRRFRALTGGRCPCP